MSPTLHFPLDLFPSHPPLDLRLRDLELDAGDVDVGGADGGLALGRLLVRCGRQRCGQRLRVQRPAGLVRGLLGGQALQLIVAADLEGREEIKRLTQASSRVFSYQKHSLNRPGRNLEEIWSHLGTNAEQHHWSFAGYNIDCDERTLGKDFTVGFAQLPYFLPCSPNVTRLARLLPHLFAALCIENGRSHCCPPPTW